MAQGIALSMAAGSLEFLADGAWTKRIHPGWAAVAGITAAALAGGGFQVRARPMRAATASTTCIWARTTRRVSTWRQPLSARSGSWRMSPSSPTPPATSTMPSPMRRWRSGATTARPEDVDSITGYISDAQANVVCRPEETKKRPQNSYDAQFSMHYTIAAALTARPLHAGRDRPQGDFRPGGAGAGGAGGFRHRPRVGLPRYYSGEIRVRTRDGRELRHRESVNRGSDANPLSAEDICAKFRDNAARAVSPERTERIFDAVMGSTAPPTSRNSTPRSVGRDRRAGNRCCLRQRENSEGNGCRPGC